jgi:hypothetical protein
MLLVGYVQGWKMSRKTKDIHEKRKRTARIGCAHYWVIESPKGPISRGACKYCGAVSEFSNYVPYPSWEGKMTKLPGRHEMSDVELGDDADSNS